MDNIQKLNKLITYGNKKFGLNESDISNLLIKAKPLPTFNYISEAELPDEIKGLDIKPVLLPNNDVLLLVNGIWLFNFTEKTIIKLYNLTYDYSAQIINDSVLISGNKGSTGILRYDIKEKTISKVYESNYSKHYFTVVTDKKCLISSSDGDKGILLYNDYTKEITVYNNNFDRWSYIPIQDRVMCVSNNRSANLYVYDTNNDSLIQLMKGDGKNKHHLLEDGLILYSIDGARTGLIYYDYNLNSAKLLYKDKTDYYYTNFLKVTDEKYLISGSASGVLVFNNSDKSIKKVDDVSGIGNDYERLAINNKAIWRRNTGLFTYNADTDEVKQIFETTSSIGLLLAIRDKCLIGFNSIDGLYVYNSLDDSFTQIYNSLRYWKTDLAIPLNDEKVCLSTSSSSYTGLYLYSYTDNSIIQLVTTKYQYQYMFHDEELNSDKYYISSRNDGLYVYNLSTDIIKRISSSGAYNNFYVTNSKKIIMWEGYNSTTYQTVSQVDPETDEILNLMSYTNGAICAFGSHFDKVYNINGKDILVGSILWNINDNCIYDAIVIPTQNYPLTRKNFNNYLVSNNAISDLENKQVSTLKGVYNNIENINNSVLMYNYGSGTNAPILKYNTHIAVLDLRRNVQ